MEPTGSKSGSTEREWTVSEDNILLNLGNARFIQPREYPTILTMFDPVLTLDELLGRLAHLRAIAKQRRKELGIGTRPPTKPSFGEGEKKMEGTMVQPAESEQAQKDAQSEQTDAESREAYGAGLKEE